MAIRVTPEELEAMAAKLEQQVQQAVALANAINSAIASGTGAWEGDAQKAYMQRFNEIKPTLTRDLPELITNMATSARKRAEAYRAADRA